MKIWTPLLRETKEKLERGIRVKRSIQESPWNLTFASVNGYDFLNNMQMKKTQTFPATKRAIPIVGWYRFCGEFTHPAREIDFLYYGSKEVEYVLVDIPEERVMLSDAFAWTSIMLGEYYAGYKSREDQRKKLEHFKNLDIFEQAFTVMHSWEQAFEVDPNSDFVFASFWSIEPWMVCSIWMVWEWWIF